MILVIVESPNKCGKIQSILGERYRVLASVGHVRDLPTREIGVSGPDYTPVYVPTERGAGVLKKLKAASKEADQVLLATDPDREGEAIAWHLSCALSLKHPQRITYHEITEAALLEAIKKPRPLDMKLVKAQECRRITDRLVGYRVSPVLSQVLGGVKASAGRVQSATLRLVVEREAAIKNFCSVTHYGATFSFQSNDESTWTATWDVKSFLQGQEYLLDRSTAEKAASLIKDFRVDLYEEKQVKKGPPPPFITTSLQKAGSSLNMSVETVMQTAQKLFEGGHITYMRTDSPALSDEALAAIKSESAKLGWKTVDKPRKWKAKDGAQEAHECIRPTHFDVMNLEDDASSEEKKLYALIWQRTMATQLVDAVFAQQQVKLSAVQYPSIIATSSSSRRLSAGWQAVYVADDDGESDDPSCGTLPVLPQGAIIHALEGAVTTKKTSPPKRYSEASLVEAMERAGIGRPSTYAATISKLLTSGYIANQGKTLIPSDLGQQIIRALVGKFSFVEIDFTRRFEELLDSIVEGTKTYLDLTSALDKRLDRELATFVASANLPQCPKCRAFLKRVAKQGAYDFWACEACSSSFQNDGGKPGIEFQRGKGKK